MKSRFTHRGLPCRTGFVSTFLLLFVILSLSTGSVLWAEVGFNQISIARGLPSSTVFAIHQDRFGFMWFGTREGLVRFDGYQVKQPWITDGSAPAILNRMITGIAEDDDGNLYVSVWGYGVYFYNQHLGKVSLLCESKGQAGGWCGRVWTIRLLLDGSLLAGTLGDGLMIYDLSKGSWTKAETIWPILSKARNIRFVDSDSLGNIWLASDELKICSLPKSGEKASLYDFEDRAAGTGRLIVHSMLISGSRLMAATSGGLYACQFPQERWLKKIETIGFDMPDIRSLVCNDGKLWLGTDGKGLIVLDTKTGRSRQYTASGGEGDLSSAVIFKIYQSRDGHIWLGTNKGGVNYVLDAEPRLHLLPSLFPQILRDKMVMALHHDRKGNLWVGTDGAGLYRVGGGKQDEVVRLLTFGKVIKAIFEDSRGNMYLGTYGDGMTVITTDGRWLRFKEKSRSLPARFNEVWAFAEDRDGLIWVGTLNGGIRLFDNRTMQFVGPEFSDQNDPTRNILVLTFHPQRNTILAGTLSGLYELSLSDGKVNQTLLALSNKDIARDVEVKSLFIDERGSVWAGTRSQGLFVLNEKLQPAVHLTKDNGLSSNTVASVRSDARGFIWVSGSSGLNRIDPSDMSVISYGGLDGLKVQEYLSESAELLHGGDLIFGGVYGADRIDPSKVKSKTFDAAVYFTGLFVMNEEVRPSDQEGALLMADIAFQPSIKLRHHQNTVTLEFIALNYAQPGRGNYAYLLEGFDKDWNIIGNQHRITFTNLDPGNYILKVKASNSDGVWSPNEASLKIVVIPPWWQMLFARLGFAALMIGFVAFMFYRRLLLEARRRQELEWLVKLRTQQLEQEKSNIENQNIVLKSTQEELLKRNAEITAQKEEIENIGRQLHEAVQLKLNFFTTISHEIRTPLTLMMSPLHEIMRRGGSMDRWLQSQLQTLHRNLLHLLDLVDQLLDFQRLERHEQKLQAFPQNVGQVLTQIWSDMLPRAEAAGLRLEISIDEGLPDVWIDVPKFTKIIYNLLSNAFKFTPTGGVVTIEAQMSEGTSELQLKQITNTLIVRISDTGIGFPPEDAERIFESFFQSSHSRFKGYGGTGLGLSIARSMARLHHATLTARAVPTGGAVFELILPLGERHLDQEEKLIYFNRDPRQDHAEQCEIPRERAGGKPRPGRMGRDQTILLVEDNPELRNYVSHYLSDYYNVYTASDGEQGWQLVQSLMPDMIISDIIMPILDGIELLKRIKGHAKYAHIPVILLTAKTHIDDKLQGLGFGATDYIGKPFLLEEIHLKVENLFKSTETLRKRYLVGSATTGSLSDFSQSEVAFFEKMNSILEEWFAEKNFGVNELVKAMNMSRSAFHIRLKRLAGLTASEWIKNFRLRKAAEMLQQGDVPVSEVGWRSGFSDSSYFIRQFRQHYGLTPGNYRKKAQEASKNKQ